MINTAISIIKTLQEAGHTAVFVGGCVRDKILGVEPKDYDIATSAQPAEVVGLFEKTIPLGAAFGVIVVVKDDLEFEVATFRTDGEYSDGRRPDGVTFASMEDDAKRRDLTINGLFEDPISGKIFDFVGGVEAIEDGDISFIGDADKRIKEDPVRMLRAVRFLGKLDKEAYLDEDAHCAIGDNAPLLSKVSSERIRDEFLKIVRGSECSTREDSMCKLRARGLLEVFLPEVAGLVDVEQSPDHHPEGDVWTHTMYAMDELPDDASDVLLMATLLHDVGKPATSVVREGRITFYGHAEAGVKIAANILSRLKFSKKDTTAILALIKNHMTWFSVKEMKLSTLKKFMRMDEFKDSRLLAIADAKSSSKDCSHIEYVDQQPADEQTLAPVKLVTGSDLIVLGVKPGPRFKELLAAVENAQLGGDIATRDEALKLLSTLV